jgi:hypothetical protein
MREAGAPGAGPSPPGVAAFPRSTMISLAHTLDALAGYLPAALVPPGGYRGARETAAQLPAALTRWTYLECRLGGRAAPVDVIVEIDAAGRDILTGANRALAPGPSLAADPVWGRVVELCRRWADPASPLSRWVESLWLEFDSGGGGMARPGVFIGFAPCACAAGNAGERCARVALALETLLGAPLEMGQRRALERCHRHLPPGASVLYAGSLLPRGDGALRVCAGGIGAGALPAFLRAAGWPGPYAPLEAALPELHAVREGAAARDPALLHLDVGADGVRPRLGLEYVFGWKEQARGRLAETAFVRHLARRGLCTGEEAAALAAFPGCATEHLPHELWRSLVVRRVNHVKLVFDGSRPAEAKGYLVLHNRFWKHAVAPTGAIPAPG